MQSVAAAAAAMVSAAAIAVAAAVALIVAASAAILLLLPLLTGLLELCTLQLLLSSAFATSAMPIYQLRLILGFAEVLLLFLRRWHLLSHFSQLLTCLLYTSPSPRD